MVSDAMTPNQPGTFLAQPHEILAALMSSLDAGVWVLDAAGSLVASNDAGQRLTGWSEAEVRGRQVHDVVHAGCCGVCPLARALHAGCRQRVEVDTFMRSDEMRLPVSYAISPILRLGQVVGAVVVFRDRTEREQVEEQLREKEAQYRSVFDATIDGLDILTLDGVIVEANPALCHITGYHYAELIGQSALPLIHPDYHDQFIEHLQTMRMGGTVQTQGLILGKDGRSIPVEVHLTCFTYLGAPHILSTIRDITERVRTEEQLREKEAQYRSIFEATSDGLVIHDLNGVVVEVNPAICRMHGFTYDELIGRHATSLIHPDSHPLFADYLRLVGAGGNFQARAFDLHKDGTAFPIEVQGTTFTFRGAPHALAVLRDITEQVHAYELLEQRIAERTRELSTLLDVSRNVASTLDLEPLLGLILDQLKTVVDYSEAVITVEEDEHWRPVEYRGPRSRAQMLSIRLPLAVSVDRRDELRRGRPVIVDDLWDDTPVACAYRHIAGAALDEARWAARSLLEVPLIAKERGIGSIVVVRAEPRAFTPQQAALVLTIANQAAMVIENARLYARAHDVAALEERHRLARELHDSVTQALYGVTMYAEAAAYLLATGEHTTAGTYLQEVRNTAQEALREMRLLVFELRPPILEQEGLVAALQARLAAVEGRVPGLTTTFDVQGELRVSQRIEEALYGIAQETLNNVFKHAQAHTVTVSLCQDGQQLRLEIGDDGIGFDEAAVQGGGGLGLRGMAERAVQVGGRLVVHSTPGKGTLVRVEVEL